MLLLGYEGLGEINESPLSTQSFVPSGGLVELGFTSLGENQYIRVSLNSPKQIETFQNLGFMGFGERTYLDLEQEDPTAEVSYTEDGDTISALAELPIFGSVNLEILDFSSPEAILEIKGTVGYSEGADYISASSALDIKGTLTFSESNDSLTLTAVLPINASFTFIESLDFSAFGLLPITASSISETSDALVGTGKLDIFATTELNEFLDSIELFGRLLISSNTSLVEENDISDLAGNWLAPTFGSLNLLEPNDSFAMIAKLSIRSELAIIESLDYPGLPPIEGLVWYEEDNDTINNSYWEFDMPFSNGSVKSPSVSFTNDIDTGLYLKAAGNMAATVGGVAVMHWQKNAISATLPLWMSGGSVIKPSLSFGTDQDTGFYKSGPNSIGFTAGGSLALSFTPKGLTLPVSNTATRPTTAPDGTIRINSQTNGLDLFVNGAWVSMTKIPDIATANDIWAGTDETKIVTAKAKQLSEVYQTITATPNNAIFINGKITITANTTFNAFVNAKEGRSGIIAITIGGSGSYTGTFDAFYDFGTAGAPTLSTAVGKTDYVYYNVLPGGTKASCVFKKAA